jgi:hypothetical protein
MLTKVLSATALIACTATAGSAATFNGDTAQFQLSGTGIGVVFDNTTTIGTSVEAVVNPNVLLDFDDTSFGITYDLTGAASVGVETQWIISDLDSDDGSFISNVTLVGGNARLVSGIGFTRDSITIDFFNFTSAQSPGSQTWEFAITTSAIPLPASLPLMLLGFGALAMNRRRKAS